MEKEFIPHNLALRLKNLGFDEPCFTYFLNGIIQPSLNPKDYTYFSEMSEINKNMLNYEYVLAPTFSQVFRWFRENYELDSFVRKIIGIDGDKLYCYEIFKTALSNSYTSFEEAELACLERLIDMTTNKKIFDFVTEL